MGTTFTRLAVRARSRYNSRMRERYRAQAANAVTAFRVLATPAFVATALWADGGVTLGALAVVLFAMIAASDVIDGRLARRCASVSDAGRTFER